ncbi:hypothetical protein G6F50_002333 [Rhizopus delemar]|uniref:EF-hand domain-containing protein n=1 Tax=Rhizopus delemar TaxID=936053 RepID=A0A9P6ZA96_9FUNG|nr:hypothetical protein G6F54_006140 [Rhizopus delemar]KAG1574015.1 hypothetical protein G6F50_002333 [Rhizopus delemar]
MFPHRTVSVDSIYKHVRLSFSKIELLDQNATGQLNQTELGEWAMKKFNLDQPLAQQTISNIPKNAETLYSNINVVNNGKSLTATHYPQLDEVVKFVADMSNNNLPVNRNSIIRYTQELLTTLRHTSEPSSTTVLYVSNEWLNVKPETINGMLPDLPRNFDNKVTDVSQLNLEADESEMIICYTISTTNNEETAEGNVDETEENDNTEQDEQRVDIVECKKRLREAYETILMYEVPLDDLDRKLHYRIRMRLTDSCAELNNSKEQTVRSYFTNDKKTFALHP